MHLSPASHPPRIVAIDDFIRKPIRNDERDAIARTRADFVSRLAHDLRVPLIAQQQMLKLMERGTFRDNPQQLAQTYRTLLGSNENLLSLVNNLLDIYRYEDGRQPLYFQSLQLNALVREGVEELTPLAESRNLDLSCQCDPDLPLTQGDRLELRRVIQNLLGNAIQFTEAGTIAVSTAQRERAGRSWACLRVRDTGAGIAPQDLEFIFERFQQVGERRGGSGLGLHLCRWIVEAHGGRIAVESELGRGSCFTIELPLVGD